MSESHLTGQPATNPRNSRPIWRSARARLAAAVLVIVLVSAAGVQVYRTIASSKPADLTLPPVDQGTHRNTAANATYVSSEKCAQCHQAEHESYLQTPHSDALGAIDLKAEPPDGEYMHAANGRIYKAYRQDGRFHHRELIRRDDGAELILADYPIHYVMGSGNFARTYLVEADGFLMESPLTWYASKQAWGLSPGFAEQSSVRSFTRPVYFRCMFCHSGRAERSDQSVHRIKVHEKAIGCESCHGPGSLHVNRHSGLNSADAPADTPDDTIVHPARLSRERKEAICGQCHLASAAGVDVRGRSIADFRPGMKITDFRVTYQLETPDKSMSVVGHMEQMRLSRCYTQTDSLTCTTCHNPHDRPREEDRIEVFRSSCLQCHEEHACGLEKAERLRQNAEDYCVACHMPQSPTDIPHFAFTHHRIGIHRQKHSAQHTAAAIGELVPLDDITHLPAIEQQRCLGLAYIDFSETQRQSAAARSYLDRGVQLLEKVQKQGLIDPDVDVALARVLRGSDPLRSIKLAQTALKNEAISPETRVNALGVLSRTFYEQGQFAHAIDPLEQLTRIRRDADDHYLLAVSLTKSGLARGALEAIRRAAKIDPNRLDLQKSAAELAFQLGRRELALQHVAHGTRLMKTDQELQKKAKTGSHKPE